MYFDPQPKTKKKNLFDREVELKQFFDALSYTSLIVITGFQNQEKLRARFTSVYENTLSHELHMFMYD